MAFFKIVGWKKHLLTTLTGEKWSICNSGHFMILSPVLFAFFKFLASYLKIESSYGYPSATQSSSSKNYSIWSYESLPLCNTKRHCQAFINYNFLYMRFRARKTDLGARPCMCDIVPVKEQTCNLSIVTWCGRRKCTKLVLKPLAGKNASLLQSCVQPWELGKKCDSNFIFTFAVVKVRYGSITTAKMLNMETIRSSYYYFIFCY